MNATAVFETDGDLFVSCPFCDAIHKCKSAETPRLIEIPAVCDETRKYVITATMKPRNFTAAIRLYQYEAKRKQEQYRRRKERTASPSADEGTAEA